jgi:predicted nucleotidyltransferase
MDSDLSLFPVIKRLVHEVLAGAQVILFGSRANGTATEESDWDVLVLTKQNVDRALKQKMHRHVFPLSVEEATVISILIIQEDKWQSDPSYYGLQQSMAAGRVISRIKKKRPYN